MAVPNVRTEKSAKPASSCMTVLAVPMLLLATAPIMLWSVAASIGALNAIVSWWPWK